MSFFLSSFLPLLGTWYLLSLPFRLFLRFTIFHHAAETLRTLQKYSNQNVSIPIRFCKNFMNSFTEYCLQAQFSSSRRVLRCFDNFVTFFRQEPIRSEISFFFCVKTKHRVKRNYAINSHCRYKVLSLICDKDDFRCVNKRWFIFLSFSVSVFFFINIHAICQTRIAWTVAETISNFAISKHWLFFVVNCRRTPLRGRTIEASTRTGR